jgi:hypothetical protein
MADELAASSSLVPVDIDAAAKDDEYFLFVVQAVVDCLDLRRSPKPKKIDGEVEKAVFRPLALPSHCLGAPSLSALTAGSVGIG